MKKFGFFITMLLASTLFFAGCSKGGSDNGYNPEDGDGTSPIITIIGGQTLLVALGSDYNDPGATAWDFEDGDLTDKIETNSTVYTSAEGNYTVIYTVTDSAQNTTVATRYVTVSEEGEQPVDPSTNIDGSTLACVPSDTDGNVSNDVSDDANEYNASEPFKKNVSTNSVDDLDSRRAQTSHNSFTRLSMVMPETGADGEPVVDGDEYHPIAVLYLEQVGGDYELGLGSADIPDPNNVDKVVVRLTRDNGQSWKDYNISNTTDRSSIRVLWEGVAEYEYPGHAQKPEMAISGQNIVVAWNDKFCPSANPFNLEGNSTVGYADDLFGVIGTQGSIDYGTLADDNITYTPYYVDFAEKYVYEAPFSCIWTARGTIDPVTADIIWHAPMQLTSGTRDTNKIWLAGSAAGFALAWQEDTMGLKAGKGAGPGEGWSGATGNRGTDIWYTSINDSDFYEATDHDDNVSTREQSVNNFHYPVRITDNEQCQDKEDGQTPYCEYYCSNYPTVTNPTGNNQDTNVTRCSTPDTDMLTDTLSLLDGDTGASRVALKILATDIEDEHIVVLGYEETKALKVRITGEGDQDQGDIPTDIEVEGKSVYFESFDFNAINDLNISDASTILTTPMPLVSAGNIINVKVPKEEDPSRMIYENARRLVIGTQIDSCDVNETGLNLTFSIMYKQSFEVQGASSDMFVRVNNGLTYATFFALGVNEVTNVSAQALTTAVSPEDYNVSWSEENLDDNTYDNGRENTFSPRIFLRGDNINIGYEYTPYETMDGEQLPGGGIFPSNFHTNLYIDGAWQGPVNITQVTDSSTSTVDARFFTTPKGSFDTTGLESDKSNPNVLFVTWGTTIQGTEADLFFKRSTDNGASWEDEQNLSSIQRTTVQEKEVESFASADGNTIYNVWLQQTETLNPETITSGLDSWFGRVDYNISTVAAPVN